MAKLLQFTPRQGVRKRVTPDGGSAVIIIFPGVRYERRDGVEPSPRRGGGKTTSRLGR